MTVKQPPYWITVETYEGREVPVQITMEGGIVDCSHGLCGSDELILYAVDMLIDKACDERIRKAWQHGRDRYLKLTKADVG